MLSDTPHRQPADAAGVLLVNPQMCLPHSTRMPLSVLNLAAVLEGRHPWRILDGNRGPILDAALATLAARPHALVGVTVMPGPQVAPAIEISAAIKAAHPHVPIAWGGYFPTLYPDSAINAPYVDYVVRGQGEATLLDLLERLPDAGPPAPLDSARDSSAIRDVGGIDLEARRPSRPQPRTADRQPGRAAAPPLRTARRRSRLPASQLHGPAHRCPSGRARLPLQVRLLRGGVDVERQHPPRRADASRGRAGPSARSLGRRRRAVLRPQLLRSRGEQRPDPGSPGARSRCRGGATRAPTRWPGSAPPPGSCFASSRLRMAYIGAEAASDEALNRMRKGSRVDHTLEVAARCRENGVIPEFSFVLGGPDDPEGEIEKTLSFIRRLKQLHPPARSSSTSTVRRRRSTGPRCAVSQPRRPPARSSRPTDRRGRRCPPRRRSGRSRAG